MMLTAFGCGSNSDDPFAVVGKVTPEPGSHASTPITKVPRLDEAPANPDIPQEPSPFRFRDVAKEAGIDFVQFSGMTAEKHFPTANGSGVAVFDYDGDGRMDLYFANGTLLPLGTAQTGSNRLYRNLGDGTFKDATEDSGLGFQGYCHGIIVGDLDNDGDQDIVLCNYGPNVLYLNNGDGTFRDVSSQSRLGRPGWSSGGACLDFDNDGDLDLYIANYGEWLLPRDDKWCGDRERNVRQYCSPREVRTVKHFLCRNDGLKDGVPQFTDVYDSAFVNDQGEPIPGRSDGHGFGVVAADLDGNGTTDLYVSNDQNPNYLFLNLGDGTFKDATETSGAAFDESGRAQSGMGVDAEDVDGDGRPELFVTNFKNEYNTLYQNLGDGLFYDQTSVFGLGADSVPWVAWGCLLGDFDNDGWPDSFVSNGHVDDNYDQLGMDIPYAQPALLHRNVPLGDGPDASRRFRLATRDAGPYFNGSHVGRGVAVGDLNDDGRLDIVVSHKDAAPAVLLNESPMDGNHWVRLHLVGTRSNRDGVGARIEVETGARTIHRQRKGGTSLESAHDPRVLIGVGSVVEVPKLTVHWPSGAVSLLEGVKTDQTIEIVEPNEAP
ncbi:MAG: CRTAC1 family protein [Isosphaeraceae bacterium]